jgi:D-alanine-D-alanine ligase
MARAWQQAEDSGQQGEERMEQAIMGSSGSGDDVRATGDMHKVAALKGLAADVTDRARRVALLYGGLSGEREISIASGNGVREVLEEEGFTVIPIDTGKPGFVDILCDSRPDVVFVALHGKGGEDGSVQGLLETLGIPYTHSGVTASVLAMDKRVSKVIYESCGLVTAAFSLVSSSDFDAPDNPDAPDAPSPIIDALIASIGLPCVVKPNSDGSSLGVSIPKTREELIKALEEGFKVGDELLVEEFISGVEVTVPVLGNGREGLLALPVIEIVPKNEFYDFESKYAEGGSTHIIPARITEEEMAACKRAAIDAHMALCCAGVSRTDIIVTKESVPCLIETNTIPGMTRTSLVPEGAREAGISPGELYRLLIHYALERQ